MNTPHERYEILKLGLLCGIVSPLLSLTLIGIAGALRPGFNPVTQYISELGERGSSTEILMRYVAFESTGFLYLCFALALTANCKHSRLSRLAAYLIALDGLGRIGAGVFPCDPGCVGLSSSQNLHHLFATLGFCSGILATVVWGLPLVFRAGERSSRGFRSEPGFWHSFCFY